MNSRSAGSIKTAVASQLSIGSNRVYARHFTAPLLESDFSFSIYSSTGRSGFFELQCFLSKVETILFCLRRTMGALREKFVSSFLFVAVFATYLCGGALAVDAPAPSPASYAGALSPPLTVIVFASSAALLLVGSLRS